MLAVAASHKGCLLSFADMARPPECPRRTKQVLEKRSTECTQPHPWGGGAIEG